MNALALENAARNMDKVSQWLNRNRGFFTFAVMALVVGMMAIAPQTAFAQDIISDKAESAMEWIKKAVYFILVVAVLGSGVLAAFGRMSWATVGQVLIGAIVAGLATEVVDALYGG